MEIERKFLLQEKDRIYPSPFNFSKLKKELETKGKAIEQSYLPTKLTSSVLKQLNKQINFKPSQLRIRKYNTKHYLTIKSKRALVREEFEITIAKNQYDNLRKFRKKYLNKIRLIKKYKNHNCDIDYYPKHDLTILEVEFKTEQQAKAFKTNMKEITNNKRYRTQKKLAQKK